MDGQVTRRLAAACAGLTLLLVAGLPPFPVNGAHSRTARALRVPVLLYHHIKTLKPTDNPIERGLTVLPAQFNEQLTYLQRNGFHTVTAAQLTDALLGTGHLPSKPVVLTFDDGYDDVYTNAYHMLRAHHMRATFFVVGYFPGQPRYMTWPQIEDMAAHGMDIEAHSLTHPDLTTLTWAAMWKQVIGSKQAIEQKIHRPVRVFAYPYGAYNAAVVWAVWRAGFGTAFTTNDGYIMRRSHARTLPRVHVNLGDTGPVYADLLAGT